MTKQVQEFNCSQALVVYVVRSIQWNRDQEGVGYSAILIWIMQALHAFYLTQGTITRWEENL